MNIVLRYCSIQSVNQSILLTSLLILSMLLVCVHATLEMLQSWRDKPGCSTHMAIQRLKGTVGSAFMSPKAGGTHPRTALLLPNTLTA